MWMIVSLAFAIVGGQASIDEPLKMNHRSTFMTLDECQYFMKSEEFGEERAALANLYGRYMRKKVAKEANETGTDIPDVAIAVTASCEEDQRL